MSNQGFQPNNGFSQGGFKSHNEGFSQGRFQDGGFSQGGFKPADEGFNQGGFKPSGETFNSSGFRWVSDSTEGNKGFRPEGTREVKREDLVDLKNAISRGKQSLAEAEDILDRLTCG